MNKKRINLITGITLLICFTLLSILSCTSEDENINTDVEYIKYGTSFGQCVGYCVNDMIITSDEVILETSGWTQNSSLPDVTYQEELDTTFLQELFEKVDFDAFLHLDEVIGCPDCADGGAEWIEIKKEDQTHKVSFEYLNNEIPELEGILESLRELHISLLKDANLIIDKDLYDTTSTNNYSITEASLNGDTLNISIAASGCSGDSWIVSLVDSSELLESTPLQRELKINLINEEVCLAFITKEYAININELKVEGENEIHLNIEGFASPIIYNY